MGFQGSRHRCALPRMTLVLTLERWKLGLLLLEREARERSCSPPRTGRNGFARGRACLSRRPRSNPQASMDLVVLPTFHVKFL